MADVRGVGSNAGDAPSGVAPPRRPNVVFIAVDDLRPEIGALGGGAKTPALDAFSSGAVAFSRHYVQVPTCGASRYALLTGRRPRRSGDLENDAFKQLAGSDASVIHTYPQLFRQAGYRTVSVGKITHSPNGRQPWRGDAPLEAPFAWDRSYVPLGQYANPTALMHGYAGGKGRVAGQSPRTEAADVDDEGYADGLIAREAVAQLEELRGAQPFLLAVGFIKPHLPFACPKRYWDLYDPDAISPAPHTASPLGVNPSITLHPMLEFRDHYAGPDVPNDRESRHLRHGYMACVSYADAQIGRVLAAIDRLGLRDDTIVVIWGDHGWHLGDLSLWGKHTTFERSLLSPLLVRAPGHASGRSEALVESVDIYPTLAELAGLALAGPLDGESLVPLLRDPARRGKAAAFSYWRNAGHRAVSVRTDRYRLVRWMKDGRITQVELYDHEADPRETSNVAAARAAVVEELLKLIDDTD